MAATIVILVFAKMFRIVDFPPLNMNTVYNVRILYFLFYICIPNILCVCNPTSLFTRVLLIYYILYV